MAKASFGGTPRFIFEIEAIMKEFPGVHTICSLTNILYILLNHVLINSTFLVAGILRELYPAILDPTDKQVCGVLKASLISSGYL